METKHTQQQVENLVRYIAANPSENLRIWCETVENGDGDTIARFANHLAACVAVRTVREQLAYL